MKKKAPQRGGARPNCGRKKVGTKYVHLRVKMATLSKIDKLRDEGELRKRRGQVIDELLSERHVPGLEYLDFAMHA